jgi:hypothetical protein
MKQKRCPNGEILSSELLDSSLVVVRDLRERNPIQGSPWIPKQSLMQKPRYSGSIGMSAIHFDPQLIITAPYSLIESVPAVDCTDSNFVPYGPAGSEQIVVHCHCVSIYPLSHCDQSHGDPSCCRYDHSFAALGQQRGESWICALVQFGFCQCSHCDFGFCDCPAAGN